MTFYKQLAKDHSESPSFQNVLDAFFMREDQDAFAQSQGWKDAAQMVYYENREEGTMTDREAEELIERESGVEPVQGVVEYLAPPPAEILILSPQDSTLHELAKVDSRETYEEEISFQCMCCDEHYTAGVY